MIALLPGDTPGAISQARRVMAQTRALPSVRSVVGVMTWTLERQQEGARRRDDTAELIAVMGVAGDPTTIPGMLLLQEGRWPRRSNEILVGAKLSREKELPVGAELRLAGRTFTVVGIGRLRGVGFSTDAFAYLDYEAFRDRAGVGDVINIMVVDAGEPALVQRRLTEVAPLNASTPAQLVKQAEEVNASAIVIRWIFSLLALSIGALFVSNMLGRSVIERRLEFATLRAIGIPSRTILLVVAAEAVMICLLASLLGIGVSLFFGWLINRFLATEYGFESLYSADAQSFLVVFALALALGAIAGLLPARQATRVDPVDILREA